MFRYFVSLRANVPLLVQYYGPWNVLPSNMNYVSERWTNAKMGKKNISRTVPTTSDLTESVPSNPPRFWVALNGFFPDSNRFVYLTALQAKKMFIYCHSLPFIHYNNCKVKKINTFQAKKKCYLCVQFKFTLHQDISLDCSNVDFLRFSTKLSLFTLHPFRVSIVNVLSSLIQQIWTTVYQKLCTVKS